jgi:hypothetical protein
MTGRPYQKFLKKANSQKPKLPDFLRDSFVLEHNLREKWGKYSSVSNSKQVIAGAAVGRIPWSEH